VAASPVYLPAQAVVDAGALTPARITDRFETVNGRHPGFRRNHAKACASRFFYQQRPGRRAEQGIGFPGRPSAGAGTVLPIGASHMLLMPQPRSEAGLQFKPGGGEEWRTAMLRPFRVGTAPAWPSMS